MLKIKEEYKGKSITCPKSRKILIINDIKDNEFDYYYNNGLDYIFEKDSKYIKYKGVKPKKEESKVDKESDYIDDSYKNLI